MYMPRMNSICLSHTILFKNKEYFSFSTETVHFESFIDFVNSTGARIIASCGTISMLLLLSLLHACRPSNFHCNIPHTSSTPLLSYYPVVTVMWPCQSEVVHLCTSQDKATCILTSTWEWHISDGIIICSSFQRGGWWGRSGNLGMGIVLASALDLKIKLCSSFLWRVK